MYICQNHTQPWDLLTDILVCINYGETIWRQSHSIFYNQYFQGTFKNVTLKYIYIFLSDSLQGCTTKYIYIFCSWYLCLLGCLQCKPKRRVLCRAAAPGNNQSVNNKSVSSFCFLFDRYRKLRAAVSHFNDRRLVRRFVRRVARRTVT